ncbi:ABC superfamily ATP binding cassette transporter, membrane protein, partial [human gut metagenome]
MTRPATAGATAGTTLAPRRRHAGRTVLRELPLLPAFILLAAFMLGPIVYALYGSLTNRTM